MPVTGYREWKQQMADFRRRVADIADARVRQLAEWCLGVSTLLVPVDTGLLRSTGKTHYQGAGLKLAATISYEGTDYGLYVHEDLTKNHKWPTQAKFLEEAIKRTFNDPPVWRI